MNEPQLSTLKENRSHGTKSFPFAAYKTVPSAKGMLVKHHWHDEIEIICFSGGDFRLEINMEPFCIRSECLYFINPGELHSILTEKSSSPAEAAIVFSPQMLSFYSYDTAQTQLIHPLCSGKIRFPRCLTPEHPAFFQVRQSFLDMMQLSAQQDADIPAMQLSAQQDADIPAMQLSVKSSLLRILALLSAHRLLIPSEKNDNKRVEEIKTAITYIRENYKEKIYVRDLASLLNLNEQYFSRFFKKAIGRSPMAYINEYRIRQSMQLLKETDLSVMEICMDCGFNNLGNFLREFRKYTGTTPLKYKKSE